MILKSKKLNVGSQSEKLLLHFNHLLFQKLILLLQSIIFLLNLFATVSSFRTNPFEFLIAHYPHFFFKTVIMDLTALFAKVVVVSNRLRHVKILSADLASLL